MSHHTESSSHSTRSRPSSSSEIDIISNTAESSSFKSNSSASNSFTNEDTMVDDSFASSDNQNRSPSRSKVKEVASEKIQRQTRKSSLGMMSAVTCSTTSSSAWFPNWTPFSRRNLWTSLATAADNWEELDGIDDTEFGDNWNRFRCDCFRSFIFELKYIVKAFFQNPVNVLIVLASLGSLIVAGYLMLELLVNRQKDHMIFEAKCTAMESANNFADLFRKALLPLYSLQQAVTHSEYFKNLPYLIGEYGTPGSAPGISGAMSPPNMTDYRNITGICDDPNLQEKFKEIVDSINKASDLEGVIVAYRLAPHSVFCMAEPLVNDKDDFGPGKVFSSKGAIGWDPLNSANPNWQRIVRNIFVKHSDEIDILGPLDKSAIGMPEMYCGHLNVKLPQYGIKVDNKIYNSWGFVMHFIHWSRLKERAGVYKIFEEKGMEFHLTRTDTLLNATTGEYYDQVATIAKSPGAHTLTDENSVTFAVTTANGEWVNRVGYAKGFKPEWYNGAVFSLIAVAFVISAMLGVILVERQMHKKLLYKIMPRRAIKKLHRGQTVIERYNLVTIFFSDIVGFTSIAGQMSPIQVMDMLNDLYKEFDKIAAKHNVYKVETIGDAYMVVGGCPDRCSGIEAAEKVSLFALDVIDFVKDGFVASDGSTIKIRCGLASGPVVAGVVGTSMPRYCLFGDTVNLASRMESTSSSMKIQCSELTYRLLRDAPSHAFALQERTSESSTSAIGSEKQSYTGVMVKGKGHMQTWWITRALRLENIGSERTITSNKQPIVMMVNVPPEGSRMFTVQTQSTEEEKDFEQPSVKEFL